MHSPVVSPKCLIVMLAAAAFNCHLTNHHSHCRCGNWLLVVAQATLCQVHRCCWGYHPGALLSICHTSVEEVSKFCSKCGQSCRAGAERGAYWVQRLSKSVTCHLVAACGQHFVLVFASDVHSKEQHAASSKNLKAVLACSGP